jgi:hypothetical protein
MNGTIGSTQGIKVPQVVQKSKWIQKGTHTGWINLTMLDGCVKDNRAGHKEMTPRLALILGMEAAAFFDKWRYQ